MNACTKFRLVKWYFIFFIYSSPCIYITYTSSHYNWFIFVPLFQFHIRNMHTKFHLVPSSSFWFLLFWPPCIYYICIPVLSEGGCPLHWDPQYDGVLPWAKKGGRPLHWLWPVALTVTRCTHCNPLHSLWPVALNVTRCIISFCKSIISLTLSVSRIRLWPWKY